MDSCQLEVEDFQSSASDSDVNSEDDTSEDPELPNFTHEDSRFSRPLVKSLNTQSPENEAASSDEELDYIRSLTPQSDMTFLKPYQIPRPETVSRFFSFPAPQWIRQQSAKPCPKSIPRAACDIDMSIDFGSLHVTKVGRTSPSGTIVTVTPPKNNSNESKGNSSIRGFPRKVAPLPRRHASPNTIITTKESSTDELPALHPRSVSSSSASSQLSSEDGGLSDHSSSSSLVTKDDSTCTMSSQSLFRSRNVVRRNGTVHALSRRKRC